MGCFASKHADALKRLDKVQQDLDAVGCKGVGGEGLEVLGECAKELREVMDSHLDSGASDMSVLERIQRLSEDILGNLESRITDDLFASPDSAAVCAQLVAISLNLDKVRATKASTKVEDQLSKSSEKGAQAQLKEVDAVLKQLTGPDELATVAPKVLDRIEETHQKSPKSKTITDGLLKYCISLAKKLLLIYPHAIAKDAGVIPVSHRIAERLDAVAVKLVAIMGATWDPPMVPQVEELVKKELTKKVDHYFGAAEAELKKTEGIQLGILKQALAGMKPWWPHMHGIEGVKDRLEALRTSVSGPVISSLQALMGTEHVQELMTFSTQLDAVFSDLEIELGLHKKMEAELTTSLALQQLEKLEEQLQAPGEIRLESISAALEELLPLWAKQAWSSDAKQEAAAQQLVSVCQSVQARYKDEVSQLPKGSRWEALRSFAVAFDRQRPELLPPELMPEDELPLLRLGCRWCAEGHLTRSEQMLFGEEAGALNPALILEDLDGYRTAMQGIEVPEELSKRLTALLTSVEERVLDAFSSASEALGALPAVAEDAAEGAQAQKRVQALLEFAGKFDQAAALVVGGGGGGSGEAPDGPGSLGRRLEAWDTTHLEAARAVLLVGSAPGSLSWTEAGGCGSLSTPPALLKALRPLRAMASRASPPREKLSAVLDAADEPVLLMCDLAAAEVSGDQAKIVLEIAQLVEAVRGKLGLTTSGLTTPRGGSSSLAETIQHMQTSMANLLVAETELGKDHGGFNPKALVQALQTLEADLPRAAGRKVLRGRLASIMATTSDRMASAMELAAAADESKKSEILLNFAKDFDDVFARSSDSAGEGGEVEDLIKARLCRVSNAACLTRLEEELEKSSGMSPAVLLKQLQDVGLLWSEMGSPGALGERLAAACAKVRERMLSSMEEAVAAPPSELKAKKAQALLKFALEFDAACSRLGDIAGKSLHEELASKKEVPSGEVGGWLWGLRRPVSYVPVSQHSLGYVYEFSSTCHLYMQGHLFTPVILYTLLLLQDVLERNYNLKLGNDDYKGMDPAVARADFLDRVKAYEKRYETIMDDEADGEISYIKLFNVGQKVVMTHCAGYLVSHIGFFLSNIHINPRCIWLTRHAESEDQLQGMLGSHRGQLTKNGSGAQLSLLLLLLLLLLLFFLERGKLYCRELSQFLKKCRREMGEAGPDESSEILVLMGTAPVHYSTLQRMIKGGADESAVESGDSSPSSPRAIASRCRVGRKNTKEFSAMSSSLLNELDAGVCNGLSYDNVRVNHPELWAERERDSMQAVLCCK
ncbi:unnamed protein product [Polarella glacialis]|uniref:6-phosphofructo-2-kinase domain-containing protein n=1 Tax=Polarella glacialis TaxID=89957 RepID=A0A813JTR0_POLGL|nr:unnamed protein product [Polarella glacialis]